MKLPLRLISFALRTPTTWGRNTLIPPAGITPTRACVSANAARSDATRKSHASASSKPPVTHGPLIAPMTGLAHLPERGERARSAASSAPPTRLRGVLPELAQVEAGAERGIGPGEDHDVDVGVGVGRRQRRAGLALQRDAQRVAGLGPVERDGADPVGGVDQHELGHARP